MSPPEVKEEQQQKRDSIFTSLFKKKEKAPIAESEAKSSGEKKKHHFAKPFSKSKGGEQATQTEAKDETKPDANAEKCKSETPLTEKQETEGAEPDEGKTEVIRSDEHKAAKGECQGEEKEVK